jgi:hypothetical protein
VASRYGRQRAAMKPVGASSGTWRRPSAFIVCSNCTALRISLGATLAANLSAPRICGAKDRTCEKRVSSSSRCPPSRGGRSASLRTALASRLGPSPRTAPPTSVSSRSVSRTTSRMSSSSSRRSRFACSASSWRLATWSRALPSVAVSIMSNTRTVSSTISACGGECGEQNRVTTFRVHLAQRPRRRTPRDGRELPHPLGRNHAQIQAIRPERLEIGELGDLNLGRVGGRRRRTSIQPHQARHPQRRIGDEQLVELVATLGRELAIQAPTDFPCGRRPGPSTRRASTGPGRAARGARRAAGQAPDRTAPSACHVPAPARSATRRARSTRAERMTANRRAR